MPSKKKLRRQREYWAARANGSESQITRLVTANQELALRTSAPEKLVERTRAAELFTRTVSAGITEAHRVRNETEQVAAQMELAIRDLRRVRDRVGPHDDWKDNVAWLDGHLNKLENAQKTGGRKR